MRKIAVFILIVLSGCSNAKKEENISNKSSQVKQKEVVVKDTVETLNGKMLYEDFNKVSSTFIRYSRNQYFAKQGYEFKDSNLSLFFNNQDWYKPIANAQIKLSQKEIEIVDSLKSIEENYGEVEYNKILYKFIFNNYPLFYIGSDPQVINNEPDEFFKAGFALLDSNMKWTMDCASIPPEYLIKNSKKYIKLIDDSYWIRKHKIEIKNIDKDCIGGEYDEMIIHLEGPSDDYNDIILGINEKGEFDVIFDEFITIRSMKRLNDSTLVFSTIKRCDLIGTMFCRKEYHFNTRTKEAIEQPYDFDKYEMKTNTRESVVLYETSSAAMNEVQDSIVGTINANTEVLITNYLDISGYEIKTDSLKGWINYLQLQKFNVSFAD